MINISNNQLIQDMLKCDWTYHIITALLITRKIDHDYT